MRSSAGNNGNIHNQSRQGRLKETSREAATMITVRRSELACPAHSLKMMAKAAASEAD